MNNKTKITDSIGDFVFAMLLSGRNSFLFHKILRERELKRYKEESIRTTLYRLKGSGYLKSSSPDEWSLTEKGKLHAKKASFTLIHPHLLIKIQNTKLLFLSISLGHKEQFVTG